MYSTIKIKNPSPTQTSVESTEMESLHSTITETTALYIPCIITPSGEPWEDGINFISDLTKPEYRAITNYETLKGIADDLVTFMNVMHTNNMNYKTDHRLKPLRPTYFFSQYIADSKYATSTGNRKINRVVTFYRWLMSSRNATFKYTLWIEKKTVVRYEQKIGLARYKEIISTDLNIKSKGQPASANSVIDDGKLFPLDDDDQFKLLQSLKTLNNYVMILIFVTSLITGARIQSVCTLRKKHFEKKNISDDEIVNVISGPVTGIDTKYSMVGVLEFPGWLYNMIKTYISSADYTNRATKLASLYSAADNYVFISTHGNPFYAANDDTHYKNSQWSPKGNSIRTFIHCQLTPILKLNGFNRSFHFHDIRATTGLNLLLDNLALVELGIISMDNLLKMVQEKLGHSKLDTTLQYLSLAKKTSDKKLIQTAWENKMLPNRNTLIHDTVNTHEPKLKHI